MNPYTQEIFNLLDDGKLNKRLADSIAAKYGIEDKTIQKELTELAVVLKVRKIANGPGTVLEKYKQIVDIYQSQIILSFRTSQSIMLQQYSTPAPIAYIAGAYILSNLPQNYQVFEPSAGNGLLTVAFDPKKVVVNEVDENRYNNLKSQPFMQVLRTDATRNLALELKFDSLFDGIITNPPFGTLDQPFKLGEYKINHLDHAMAIRALNCMKDNGRAAIIIGGHTNYDTKGRVQAGKNRIFLTYLYSHYNVNDIINIDGSLYSRQGTSFNVRLILIDGRKDKPEGFPPLKNADSKPITSFDELLERITPNFKMNNKIITLARAKAKALLLIQSQNINTTMGEVSDFGELFTQFKGKPKQAIKHLMKVCNGEAIAALYREDIGSIDIVWGEHDSKTDKGFGLKHIIEKHGNEIEQLGFKVEDFIPIVVQFGDFNMYESDENKRVYESRMFRFIIRTTWNGKKKQWLLSAFDLRKKPKQ